MPDTPAGADIQLQYIDPVLASLLAPAETDVRSAAEKLTGWLCVLVRSKEYGQLADLRRPQAITRVRLIAAAYAPEERQRPVYEYVAFLFARYHAGQSAPRSGFGNMGDALRKLGSPGVKGPKDTGACRLLDRLVASRQLPRRHLQHAIERCRASQITPPSWTQLTEELCRWSERGRTVPYSWARSFYTPTFDPKNRTTP